MIRSLTVIEDGADRVRSIYVAGSGVQVSDKDRSFRFRCDLAGAETTWQVLARIAPHILAAEERAIRIENLANRCRTGWIPVAGEIDRDIRQRTLLRSHLAIDAIRYPDDLDGEFYLPATVLLGVDERGHAQPTGEILWIAADRSWAICDEQILVAAVMVQRTLR